MHIHKTMADYIIESCFASLTYQFSVRVRLYYYVPIDLFVCVCLN